MTAGNDEPASTDASTPDHVGRAQVLIDQRRYDLAEKELGRALVADPEDWRALALHGLAAAHLKRFSAAINDVQAALGLAPDNANVHAMYAQVLLQSQRYAQAESAAREAIRLDPTGAEHFGLLGAVLLGRRRWADSLAAFDRALASNPASGYLAGRAICLIHLNRLADARASAAASLGADPGSSFGQAVRGYLALHDGHTKESVAAFREALRIDPTNEFALDWLREAAIGRSHAYRLVQRYQLWSTRSGNVKAAGALVVLRLIPGINLLVLALVWWSWVAVPVVKLGMIRDPLTRMLLGRADLIQGLLVASLLVAGTISAAIMIGTGSGRWGFVAAACLLLAVPVAQVLRMSPGWPRKTLVVWSLIVGVLGLIGSALALLGVPLGKGSAASPFLGYALLAVLILFFVGNRLANVAPPLSGE